MYQNRVSIIGFVGNDAPPSQKIRSLAADNSSAPGVSNASSLPSVRTHWCRRRIDLHDREKGASLAI